MQLNTRANRLARALVARGVGRDVPVGIIMDRSFELVVAILAALKAGGCYVPLDPDYPDERLAAYVADSGAVVVLTQRAHVERAERLSAQQVRSCNLHLVLFFRLHACNCACDAPTYVSFAAWHAVP